MTNVVTMAVRPRACVQFVPMDIVHRAAFALADDDRRYEVWQDKFEEEYNVKFGTLNVGTDRYTLDRYTLIFPSDQDYALFLLRWA